MYPYKKPRPDVPLAPFVDITVAAIIPKGSSKQFEFLLDSGADCTCLSSETLADLNSLPVREAELESAGGQKTKVCVHLVTLSFGGRTFLNTPVLEIQTCLLGRDIINQFRIELNGPSEYLEIF